jgi:hypothetical protein
VCNKVYLRYDQKVLILSDIPDPVMIMTHWPCRPLAVIATVWLSVLLVLSKCLADSDEANLDASVSVRYMVLLNASSA